MRHCLAIAALLALAALPAAAQDEGLHNSTKTFTDSAEMTEADWTDPAEMERAWAAAVVRVPADGGSERVTMDELQARLAGSSQRYPTVIYLHGCSGIWPGTHMRMELLAANGYLVIAPASLARHKYPKSCDPVSHEGGMYRETLKMRQADAGYAIEQAKALPFVDPDRIALVGLSEGAITAATFDPGTEAQFVAARVVEGWTCNAGWSEYGGIGAPSSEPVLTLVAANDPWFRAYYSRGDCGYAIDETNGSKSVVFTEANLADRHELLEFDVPQREALEFLDRYVKNR